MQEGELYLTGALKRTSVEIKAGDLATAKKSIVEARAIAQLWLPNDSPSQVYRLTSAPGAQSSYALAVIEVIAERPTDPKKLSRYLELISNHAEPPANDLGADDSEFTAPLASLVNAAAVSGDAVAIEWLARKGVRVNMRDPGSIEGSHKQWKPIHHAAHGGHVDAVAALLNAGANASATGKIGETPLHSAAASDAAGALTIARYLLRADANVDAADSLGVTPLHLAARWAHEDIVGSCSQRERPSTYATRTSGRRAKPPSAAARRSATATAQCECCSTARSRWRGILPRRGGGAGRPDQKRGGDPESWSWTWRRGSDRTTSEADLFECTHE